jgi:ribosomal protein S18 acetylase RimI-like enzyme
MELQVRPVRADEYRRAGEVVVAAYEALPGAHNSAGYAAELADIDRRVEEAEVFVAIDGDDVIGCVTLVPDATSPWAEMLADGEAGIRLLAVEPACQRRGVGQLLLDACVSRAVELGRKGLLLHSTPWMNAAHRLYERNGFARLPERDWLPDPDVPLLAFRLDLDLDLVADRWLASERRRASGR